MTGIKSVLKGCNYNIVEDRLICQRKDGVSLVFRNKDNNYFQDLLSSLKKATPVPDLDIDYEKPYVEIPLDLFYRILRSNEVVYEQLVGLRQSVDGLYCFSNTTKSFQLNHYEYPIVKEVYVDPKMVCKITRKIRDRERVLSKILLEKTRIILTCELPWVEMVFIIPTVPARGD